LRVNASQRTGTTTAAGGALAAGFGRIAIRRSSESILNSQEIRLVRVGYAPIESVIALIPILRINVFTALEGFSLAFAFAGTQKLRVFGRKHELLKEFKPGRTHSIG